MIDFRGITVIRMDALAPGTMLVSPDVYDMLKGKEADPQLMSAIRRTAEGRGNAEGSEEAMTDHAELRRLAEACDVSRCADEGEERRRLHDFYDCIEPELILSMLNEIAENDSVVAVWRGRTQRTEEERDRLKAENEALRGALHAVQAEVDGNLRPLTRDLVNMVSGLNNGCHPNDIYEHCDEIERIIGAALEGATQ